MSHRKVGSRFGKEFTSKVILLVLAFVLSGMLILSMPIISAVVKGEMFKSKKKKTTALVLKKLDLKKPKPKPKKKKRRPKRSKPNHRTVKSGPRFAMNLDVAGSGGANVSIDLVNKTRGSGEEGNGDVDSKPRVMGRLDMEVPQAISDLEIDAEVVLTFCVDISGKAFDIRVLDESPPGKGLGPNGVSAIQNGAFEPAMANNEAVPFCGVEKEFMFKFSE